MTMENNSTEPTQGGGNTASRQRGMRHLDEETNPCVKEDLLSQSCLKRNNYKHSSCQDYFENYRKCKQFWGKVTLKRRREGIKPHLPSLEDRPAAKKKFIAEEGL